MLIRIVQISSLATACTTSAHILEPYRTKLDICPDSCSVKDNLYCFASVLPKANLKGIVA